MFARLRNTPSPQARRAYSPSSSTASKPRTPGTPSPGQSPRQRSRNSAKSRRNRTPARTPARSPARTPARSFAFSGKPWHVKPNRARTRRANANNSNDEFYDAHENFGEAARRQNRVNQIKRQFVNELRARAAKHTPASSLANAMNSAWTGQAVRNIRANRRERARRRWRMAINASRPAKAKLLEAVKHAYLALDAAARAHGYSNLTELIQANLSAKLEAYYDKFKKEFVASRSKYYAAYEIVRHCSSPVLHSASPARVAAYLVTKGWDAACDRYGALDKVSRRINDAFLKGVDGAMKRTWAGVGRAAAWAIPMAFDKIVKDKLGGWVSRVDPRLERLIDYDQVTRVLQRHQGTVGAALVGKNVDLLDVVMDLARTLDSCVVQALVSSFLPHFQLPPECSRV